MVLWPTLIFFAPLAGAAPVGLAAVAGLKERFFASVAAVSLVVPVLSILWMWTGGVEFAWRVDWLADEGIGFGWIANPFSYLFGLLVTGIGFLTVVFSARYAERMRRRGSLPHRRTALFFVGLLLFASAMLGVVFSEDLFQLYLFWELADLASFLLISLQYERRNVRRAAFRALAITTLGGTALFVAAVLLSVSAATSSIPELLNGAAAGIDGWMLHTVTALILIAAATKSAQVPFHVWLPPAMVAPTPVNAYLDSATLVAAGAFLLLIFEPMLGASEVWFWGLASIGIASMLTGGVLALREPRLKWLLAYSTISQYGFIYLLIAVGTVPAVLFFVAQHALVKAGLFLSAGATEFMVPSSSRHPGRSGHGRTPSKHALVPVWLSVAGVATLALSLAGLPPLGGFWMKEFFLADLLDHTLAPVLVPAAVIGAALTAAYSFRFISMISSALHWPGAATLMLVPVLMAASTLLVGLAVLPLTEAAFAPAAAAITGLHAPPDVAAGLKPELLLSLAALLLGGLLFLWMRRRAAMTSQVSLSGTEAAWTTGWEHLMRLGQTCLLLQNGSLTRYTFWIVAAIGAAAAVGAGSSAQRQAMPDVCCEAGYPDSRPRLTACLYCSNRKLSHHCVRPHVDHTALPQPCSLR